MLFLAGWHNLLIVCWPLELLSLLTV